MQRSSERRCIQSSSGGSFEGTVGGRDGGTLMRRASFASELGDEAQRALDEAAAALPAVAVNVAHGGVSHSPGSGDDDGLATPTMLRQVAAGEHFGALVTGE